MANIKPMAVNKKTVTPDRNDRSEKSDKMDRLAATLMKLCEDRFTGYIRINFSQGSIGRVEKFEEILKK
ncbi:MAG: hypothetical protein SWH61_12335 [Thermodesulfobacteriota bacterium]|nr:hypothetical protein [Thermodesulfobacteriota bacterium]